MAPGFKSLGALRKQCRFSWDCILRKIGSLLTAFVCTTTTAGTPGSLNYEIYGRFAMGTIDPFQGRVWAPRDVSDMQMYPELFPEITQGEVTGEVTKRLPSRPRVA